MSAFLVLAVTFGLMYVLFLRPQAKRVKAHRELLQAVEVGDEVMLTSGLYGTVVEVDDADDVLWLAVADDVELKVARGAVAKRVTDSPSRALAGGDVDDDDDAAAGDEGSADDLDEGLIEAEVDDLRPFPADPADPTGQPEPPDPSTMRPDPSDPR